jgi:histidinol phosphatase-like enzyme (inositol monophosphatase family)
MATIEAPDALAERLAAARRAAVAAGRETLRWFRHGDLAVTLKADRSPVTQADLAAEAVLRRELLGAFPDDGFLGEETGATRGRSGYEWVCDPIDGTKSFIHGVPLYATLVGCRRIGDAPEAAGSPIVGVIAIPAADESVFAAVGSGAWHQRGDGAPTPARVSPAAALSDGLFVTSDATSFDARGRRDARDALEATCRLSRTWGDGYGYLLVATGRAEAMIDPLLNPWDAAAVMPVIVEAGGRFSDWRGLPRIDSGDGIATNGLVHAEVLEILRERS